MLGRMSAGFAPAPPIPQQTAMYFKSLNVDYLLEDEWYLVEKAAKKESVFVYIWDSECEDKLKAFSRFKELAAKYRKQPVSFISFDIGKNEELKSKLQISHLPEYRIMMDGKHNGQEKSMKFLANGPKGSKKMSMECMLDFLSTNAKGYRV